MEKFKFLIPIVLMALTIGGLIWIGANRKTDYTPAEEVPATHLPENYPEQFTCEGHACDKL
jgi:hypothetical protein